jgi:hypothetical protein
MPGTEWFDREVVAITEGLLTQCEIDALSLGPRMRVLVRLVVRQLACQREPFTIVDVYQLIERGDDPVPLGTTPAQRESLLRRLNRVVERSSPARAETGGQP